LKNSKVVYTAFFKGVGSKFNNYFAKSIFNGPDLELGYKADYFESSLFGSFAFKLL